MLNKLAKYTCLLIAGVMDIHECMHTEKMYVTYNLSSFRVGDLTFKCITIRTHVPKGEGGT